MIKKNITINDLAIMVQKGFDGVDKRFDGVDKRFDGVDQRLDKVESDIKTIKKDLSEVKYDLKENIKCTDKLEIRVDYVENVLAIKKN